MNEILLYLTKSTLILSAFYVVYVLLMRSDTHYQLRRFYLLISMLAATIIPLLPMSSLGIVSESAGFDSWIMITEQGSTMAQIEGIEVNAWTIMDYVVMMYVLGCTVMLLRLIKVGNTIRHLMSKVSFSKYQDCKLAYSSEVDVPFSFFYYIFLPETEKEREADSAILTHEALHARYKHSLDILLVELHLLFFWFNPISWFIKHSIREVHEYQIDGSVLDLGFDKKAYQFLLLNYSVGAQKIALANSFNLITTKKRISMMNKKKSPKPSALKYLAFLPIVFLSLVLMSSSPVVAESAMGINEGESWIIKGKVINEENRSPLVGATILIKGTQTGSLTDNKGEFTIEVPKGSPATLLFSFVGLNKYEVEVENSGELTVYLAKSAADSKYNFQKMAIMLRATGKDEFGKQVKVAIGEEDAPLIVVDGKIVKKGVKISDLNPDDIESVNVLKNEKALEAYGDKGKNGVVEIKTKKK